MMFIIHSKYIPVSDWLKSPGWFFIIQLATVDTQIWKKFADIQGNTI